MWLLFLCALVTTTGQRVFWSSIFSLLTDVSDPGDRDKWFGLGGMMQAAGFGVGALAAGALLTFDGNGPFLIAMAVNAVTFFIAGFLLLRLHVAHSRTAAADAGNSSAPLLRKDKPFLVLIGVNTVLALASMMIGAGLPYYVAEALPAPKWIVGVLLAAISVVLATGQTLVVRHTAKRRKTHVLVLAGLLWAVWGVLMASLLHLPAGLVVPGLVLATAVFAFADVLHAATGNALAAAVAPKVGHGKYLSYWQYSFAFASVLAPALFGQLFDVRREFPWLAISLLALVAAGTIVALERVLPDAAVGRDR
jgi:Na+/melibiose symporter-like transporter